MKIRDTVTNFFRGMLMGIADLFPGISGGTVALILGIYPRLMAALSGFNHRLFVSLTKSKKEIRKSVKALDAPFLLPLVLGIATSIIVGAHLTSSLIRSHPVVLMSFFIGFLLASVQIPWKMIKKKNSVSYLTFAVFVAIAAWLSMNLGFKIPDNGLFILFSGIVAVSFMLLPGVSGSSALLLLGTYTVVIDAVSTLNVVTLSWLLIGIVIGIMITSRGISFMLKKHHDITFAALTGLLAGSMVRVWPIRTSAGFAEGLPILSNDIFSLTVLGSAIVGAGVVLAIERIGQKR